MKPSALKREHSALQNMKFLTFSSIIVGHFCPPGSGSGSTDLIESGSSTDPKHWFFYPASRCAAHIIHDDGSQKLLSTCPPRLKGKQTFTFLFRWSITCLEAYVFHTHKNHIIHIVIEILFFFLYSIGYIHHFSFCFVFL